MPFRMAALTGKEQGQSRRRMGMGMGMRQLGLRRLLPHAVLGKILISTISSSRQA